MKHGWLIALVGISTVAGCGQERPRAGASRDQWVRLLSRGGITAYVDMSRVVDSGSFMRVWLRFDYDQALPKMESTTGPYIRTEALEDLNCRDDRARDVELKLIDTTNALVGDTLWGSGPWVPFNSHPLGAHILEPACEQLNRAGRAA